MNTNLKKYQREALGKLVEDTSAFLDRNGKGEIVVFQAPTGSGKTIVMARFIEELIKERNKDDICFIWLSVGKGELHIQSMNSLRAMFDGFPKVSLVDEEFGGARSEISRNEVVVGNWEKLNKRDSTTGEWKVTLMKDGEQINFREVLAKTNEKRKIILIIDESQIGAGAPRVSEVRELVNADVIIEVSATPSVKELIGDIAFVKVEAKDVIEQGMIKKELIINPGLFDAAKILKDEGDAQRTIMELAYKKRVEIKKAFEKIGSNVNPLVLVQIPDAEAGERRIEAVLDFLREKKETVENGKVGIWLSDKKTDNLDGITRLDDDTNFLIFKQAINVGWDCPRAHILLKLRDVSNSESFEIQTVGRILRMPERKHYGDDLLDVGYVFSNAGQIMVKPDEYKMDIIKSRWAKRRDDYKDIKLQSFYSSRVDYGDVRANFYESFEEAAKEFFDLKDGSAAGNIKALEIKGLNTDGDKYKQRIISDTGLSSADFDQLEGNIRPEAYAKFALSADEVEMRFYDQIRQSVRDAGFGNLARSAPIVAQVLYTWFEEYLGARKWKEWVLMVQSMVTDEQNKKYFADVLQKTFVKYENVRKRDIAKRASESGQEYVFEIPEVEYFSENGDELIDRVPRYVLKPCYLSKSRSGPEKRFENFLEDHGEKLDWWYKNGENKKEYFGVVYELPDGEHTFYPDYIVKFKNGRVGIYETKDEHDQDGATVTKAKAEALQDWMSKQKRKDLVGGIAIERNGQWLLHSGKKYQWDNCQKGDWGDWKVLDI